MPMNQARPKNGTKTGMDLPFSMVCLRGDSEGAAFEAAKRIRRQSDVRLLRPLIHLLEHGRKPLNRAAAAYALSDLPDSQAIAALERTLANKLEDPKVRGYAAEALAHHHRKQTHSVLLRNVTDSCEEVRFWCAFALGEMTEVDTLRLLRSVEKNVVRNPLPAAKATEFIGGIQERLSGRGGACPFCVAS